MVTVAMDAGQHHHGCFHAEQAAQQSLKGLLRGLGAPERALGHNLTGLAEEAAHLTGMSLTEEIRDALARLARHYIPSRYPDALPTGSPADHYRKADAAAALADARLLRRYVDEAWATVQAAAATSTEDPDATAAEERP